MRLKDKVAIITGGAHGMGEAEARLFAKEGAIVIIADRRADLGEALAADITASQGRASFIAMDVAQEADWKRLIERTLSDYGRIDVLVNNAGISGSAVGDMLSLEGWNQLMSINATGVFLGTTLVGQVMAGQGKGSIVNISSIMGFVSSAEGHPGYSASKGAVRLLTKNAAVRWGPQIIAQPLVIALLAVPIIIQVYFNAGLAYWLNRQCGSAHAVAGPSALIGASNFFELAVAAAISLFGFDSGAALATVVGVLVEVPVMLSVVAIVMRSKAWYQRA